MSSRNRSVRGPGSNQHADKPPLAPRDPVGASDGSSAVMADADPFGDDGDDGHDFTPAAVSIEPIGSAFESVHWEGTPQLSVVVWENDQGLKFRSKIMPTAEAERMQSDGQLLDLPDSPTGDAATLPAAPGETVEVGNMRVSVEQGRRELDPDDHIVHLERRRDDGSWSRVGFGHYASELTDLRDGSRLAVDLGAGTAMSEEETALLKQTALNVRGS